MAVRVAIACGMSGNDMSATPPAACQDGARENLIGVRILG